MAKNLVKWPEFWRAIQKWPIYDLNTKITKTLHLYSKLHFTRHTKMAFLTHTKTKNDLSGHHIPKINIFETPIPKWGIFGVYPLHIFKLAQILKWNSLANKSSVGLQPFIFIISLLRVIIGHSSWFLLSLVGSHAVY